MIVLISVLTAMTIFSCAMKYRKTIDYIHFKNSHSFKNFVIGKSEMGDYSIVHYMCKGKIYSYIHHMDDEHVYTNTPELSVKERANKHIVFATFETPKDTNFQIVTKKVRKFAGADGSFYNWDTIPFYIKRRVLKAPKEATNIRIVYGDGTSGSLSLMEKHD